MTHEEIKALSDRAIDAEIARAVMGWTEAICLNATARGKASPKERYWTTIHSYSTDANASRLVLEEIEKRGLQREFVEELCGIAGCGQWRDFPFGDVWLMLNAAPRATCEAALITVGGTT